MAMRFLLILLLSTMSFGATVLRMACGGPGGVDSAGNTWSTDANFNGGARWGATNQPELAAQPVPYQTLRYSANPPGAPVAYIFQLVPSAYRVTLKFLEPNKTAAGQRLFSVSINGGVVVSGLDLFAAVGLLKPYELTFPVSAPTGKIQINLTATLGNAVLSAVQIDDVPVSKLTRLQVCSGSGPGDGTPDALPWDCAGIWQASITLSDGSSLLLFGVPMPALPAAFGVIWTDK
jgi:hypothetical protein